MAAIVVCCPFPLATPSLPRFHARHVEVEFRKNGGEEKKKRKEGERKEKKRNKIRKEEEKDEKG